MNVKFDYQVTWQKQYKKVYSKIGSLYAYLRPFSNCNQFSFWKFCHPVRLIKTAILLQIPKQDIKKISYDRVTEYSTEIQQGTVIGIMQPPPKEGVRSALFSILVICLRQLCSKAFQAPSFGGGFVISITVPHRVVQYNRVITIFKLLSVTTTALVCKPTIRSTWPASSVCKPTTFVQTERGFRQSSRS